MNRKIVVFVTLAVVLAAVFVRLGFWQVRRLDERRARNAGLVSRLSAPVVPFEQLRDTISFRHATVAGAPDFDHEIVFTGRSRNGSPGVYILTPIRRSDSDTAVIVIRGWVYAPDAATVELSRWRESRTSYGGYVVTFQTSPYSAQRPQRPNGRKVRHLNRSAVQALLPYPVAAQYVVTQDSAGTNAPARLAMPTLDNGPHLSYAIQWFAFATIAVVGAAIVAFRRTEPRTHGSTGA